jgi:effector-binding domain-containing protein
MADRADEFRRPGRSVEMMTEPKIEERLDEPYTGIRETVTMETLPSAIDRGFPALFGRLAERGVSPAGAPFIRYLRVGDEMEIDLGVPVADGEHALPAGRWLVALHVGHFSGLRTAHGELQEWAREHGIAWSEFCERYLTDPREEPDSSRWETELAYLIE